MFVALDLPHETRRSLAIWASELIELRPRELRAIPAGSLHVTLAFLGYRYMREADRIGAAIEVAAGEPLSVAFARAPVPKPSRAARLYAAAVEANPTLEQVRAALVGDLEAARLYEDERRGYWPHVTLCRVKSSIRRHQVIEHLPGAAPALREAVAAPSITLYRSELRPEGAVYTSLFTCALPLAPDR
jgi:2'-5' RNA ligase